MQAYDAEVTDLTAADRFDHRARSAMPATPALDAKSSHFKALWPAALLLAVGLAGLAAATLAPTGKGDQYAVIAPPWYTMAQTIDLVRNTQGQIVEIGKPFRIMPGTIVITHSARPDFVTAAYRAGAWLVIDPMRLRGCIGLLPISGKTRT